MKYFLRIAKGLFFILLTASVLLFSDLSNRHKKEKNRINDTNLAVATAGRTYKMGLAYFAPEASYEQLRKGLFEGLADLGYIKGENLIVKEQHVNGELATFHSLFQNFDNLGFDVIVPTSTPGVTAACASVKKTPVAFTYTFDPIAAGAGESLTNHLPNVTGVGSFPPIEKTFKLIKNIFPEAKRIGTLYNSSEANSRKVVEVAKEVIAEMDLELVETTVVNSSEVIQAMQILLSRNIDVLWITGDNTAMQALDAIIKAADKAKIPVILNDVDLVDKGALAAVGIGWYNTGYHSATMVAKVMNGMSTAETPIENYVTEQVVFNEPVAERYNITVPQKYQNSENKPPQVKPDHKLKLALVHYVDSNNSEDVELGIRKGLLELGLKKNIDFDLQIFNAQGDISTLNSITESIKTSNYDLIFTTSTPTIQSLVKKITDTPIVFCSVGDPIAAGIAQSTTDHIPNITGISTMSDFKGMIEMVKKLIPDVKAVGTVYCPAEINSVAYANHLEEACKAAGIICHKSPANNATDVMDAATSLASKNIDAICQISDNLTVISFASIIQKADRAKIPVFSFVNKQLAMGSLAAVSRNYEQAGHNAALLAGKILNGQNPQQIPWEYVSKTNIDINKEKAKQYGITIPADLLKEASADKQEAKPSTLKKIAFVHFMSSGDCIDTEIGFREQLKTRGWIENKDYSLTVYNAQAEIATVLSIANTIKSLQFDIIVSNVSPTVQTLAQQITDIPQIFTIVADPVSAGLGVSYTDHLPHVTGIDSRSDVAGGLDLLLRIIPNAKSIGGVYYPADIGTVSNTNNLRIACEKRGVRLELVTANTQSEVGDAIMTLCQKDIDAVLQIPDNVTIPAFSSIIKTTRKMHKPLFCFITSQIQMGAIGGSTIDYQDQGMDAADLAIDILNGKNPKDIPFQNERNPRITVNPIAAEAYGITLSKEILQSADVIITE